MYEQKKTGWNGFFIAVGLVVGLFLLGYELGKSIVAFKAMNRVVVVKGLAEKEVPADLVIWPLQFSSGSNDTRSLTQNINEKNEEIISFLKAQGFPADEISVIPLSITDHEAETTMIQGRRFFDTQQSRR